MKVLRWSETRVRETVGVLRWFLAGCRRLAELVFSLLQLAGAARSRFLLCCTMQQVRGVIWRFFHGVILQS